MSLSTAFLDELRARTTLSSVITPSVKLIRAGREWKACCPFHNEKTPSFTVNDDKGFYHCLAGETVVLTRQGRTQIADLAGQTAEVLGPSGRWIAAPFAEYGQQRLWEISLSRDSLQKSLFATSHHRWFVRGSKSEVLTMDLRAGSLLTSATPDDGGGWMVRGVQPVDRNEPVFCAQVPDDHAFALDDNILTGNCFGCGAHGDAIRFLTDNRGMPFMDAVKELAAKAGLEVPALDPRAREVAERAASLTDVMDDAAKWYSEQLNGLAGGPARDYLTARGIDPETAQRFGLGLAPDSRTALKRALEKHGEEKLVETGMLIRPEEKGKESYDRFRGRLMIPIRDARGRVIGFGGRILGEGEPKYLNSPQTVLFDKGRTLYNLDRAGPASRATKRVIVVEGYMDVIALDRAGISEVVAPNGTALTEGQLERLWRLDPSPILCFDGDGAGRKAAIRAATRALPLLRPDRTLRFIELPSGQDPDDLIRSGGRDAFEALVSSPEPLDARLWRHELALEPMTTPEAWAGLKQRLIDYASQIAHADLSKMYREDWLNRFFQQRRPDPSVSRPFTPRTNFRNGRFAPPAQSVNPNARAIATSGIDALTARALILGFANYPEELTTHCEQLASLPIADKRTAKLRDDLVNAAFSGTTLDQMSLHTILGGDGATGDKGPRTMGFSFTRRDSDPDRARSDLAAAVEIIAAAEEVERALEHATERLKRDFTDEALEEQQRLIEAQRGLRQRLAHLAGTD